MSLSSQDQQLFHAIQAQDMQAAQQAVQAGANIHVQTPEGTPLHAAVKVKHLGLVQWLVKQGAEINLTDKDFKTPIEIAAASKQADILAYLLAHRQSLSASQLNYILMACVAKHPTTEIEDYRVDTQLVNFIVSRLTRLNMHALLTTNRNWERVIVQLFSIKGEKREDTVLLEGASAEQLKKEGTWIELEGWRQHEFLAIRIRALFELYLRISVEDMRKQALYPLLPQATADANVAAILNALQQELLTTIETLATYHDVLAIKNFVPSKRIQLRQAIARNVTAKVLALADGKEYPLACGWGDARKGHALYVSFMVYPRHIVPRIDNTDEDNNQAVGKSYHRYINEQRLRDGQMVNKVLSYVPGQWDKLKTQPIQTYVEALLEASMAGKAESFAKIYQPAVEPLTVLLNIPGTQVQTIGNCPVKNHHVGLHIRLKDKAFYRWVRREESKIIISLHAAKDQPLDISAYWALWQANLTVEATPRIAVFHLQTHLLRSLKASYAKHGYINRLFGTYTNHQEDSLSINKSYIHLAITPEEIQKQKEQQVFKDTQPANTAQLSQAIYENAKTIDVQELFEIAKGKQQIAVIGRPGVGKSTFCQYVAWQWAEGAEWLSQFQWLFWIEARDLKSAWYEKKSYYEIIDIVARECFNRPLSNLEAAILQQAIDQNRVLWLIDGHDALAGQALPANIGDIVDALLAKTPLIMTSRPFYLKLAPTFFRVEIIGFTPDDIKEYVKHFFTTLKLPQPERAHQLLEYLQKNPYTWELGRLPLQLELLCSVYLYETLQGNQALTQTELYQKIMAWLLRRYLIERKKVKPERIDDDAHVLEVCEEVVPGLFSLIKQLAFDEFYAGNTILGQANINQYRTTLLKDKPYTGSQWLALKSELSQIGLFTKAYRSYESTNPNDDDYYFIHPTFQEFIAAWFIADHINAKRTIIILKVGGGELKYTPEQFIAQYKYHPRFNIVWWFVAGKLNDESYSNFFNTLFEEPNDFINIYSKLQIIRCLDELQLKEYILIKQYKEIKAWAHTILFEIYEYAEIRDKLIDVLKLSPFFYCLTSIKQELFNLIFNEEDSRWAHYYEEIGVYDPSELNQLEETLIAYLQNPILWKQNRSLPLTLAKIIGKLTKNKLSLIKVLTNFIKNNPTDYISVNFLKEINILDSLNDEIIKELKEIRQIAINLPFESKLSSYDKHPYELILDISLILAKHVGLDELLPYLLNEIKIAYYDFVTMGNISMHITNVIRDFCLIDKENKLFRSILSIYRKSTNVNIKRGLEDIITSIVEYQINVAPILLEFLFKFQNEFLISLLAKFETIRISCKPQIINLLVNIFDNNDNDKVKAAIIYFFGKLGVCNAAVLRCLDKALYINSIKEVVIEAISDLQPMKRKYIRWLYSLTCKRWKSFYLVEATQALLLYQDIDNARLLKRIALLLQKETDNEDTLYRKAELIEILGFHKVKTKEIILALNKILRIKVSRKGYIPGAAQSLVWSAAMALANIGIFNKRIITELIYLINDDWMLRKQEQFIYEAEEILIELCAHRKGAARLVLNLYFSGYFDDYPDSLSYIDFLKHVDLTDFLINSDYIIPAFLLKATSIKALLEAYRITSEQSYLMPIIEKAYENGEPVFICQNILYYYDNNSLISFFLKDVDILKLAKDLEEVSKENAYFEEIMKACPSSEEESSREEESGDVSLEEELFPEKESVNIALNNSKRSNSSKNENLNLLGTFPVKYQLNDNCNLKSCYLPDTACSEEGIQLNLDTTTFFDSKTEDESLPKQALKEKGDRVSVQALTKQKTYKEEAKLFVSNVIYGGNPIFSKKSFESGKNNKMTVGVQHQEEDEFHEEPNYFKYDQFPNGREKQVFRAQEEIIDQDFFNQFDDDFDDDELDVAIDIRYTR